VPLNTVRKKKKKKKKKFSDDYSEDREEGGEGEWNLRAGGGEERGTGAEKTTPVDAHERITTRKGDTQNSEKKNKTSEMVWRGKDAERKQLELSFEPARHGKKNHGQTAT